MAYKIIIIENNEQKIHATYSDRNEAKAAYRLLKTDPNFKVYCLTTPGYSPDFMNNDADYSGLRVINRYTS